MTEIEQIVREIQIASHSENQSNLTNSRETKNLRSLLIEFLLPNSYQMKLKIILNEIMSVLHLIENKNELIKDHDYLKTRILNMKEGTLRLKETSSKFLDIFSKGHFFYVLKLMTMTLSISSIIFVAAVKLIPAKFIVLSAVTSAILGILLVVRIVKIIGVQHKYKLLEDIADKLLDRIKCEELIYDALTCLDKTIKEDRDYSSQSVNDLEKEIRRLHNLIANDVSMYGFSVQETVNNILAACKKFKINSYKYVSECILDRINKIVQ